MKTMISSEPNQRTSHESCVQDWSGKCFKNLGFASTANGLESRLAGIDVSLLFCVAVTTDITEQKDNFTGTFTPLYNFQEFLKDLSFAQIFIWKAFANRIPFLAKYSTNKGVQWNDVCNKFEDDVNMVNYSNVLWEAWMSKSNDVLSSVKKLQTNTTSTCLARLRYCWEEVWVLEVLLKVLYWTKQTRHMKNHIERVLQMF